MGSRSIRNETEAGILQALAFGGPQSRASLARHLGVMRSTVGPRVARLLEQGLIRLAEPATGPRPAPGVGRPGTTVELNPEYCHFVGVDVSVGHVRVMLADLQCHARVFNEVSLTLAEQTPERVADLIVMMVTAVTEGYDDVAGITISVPGIVTRDGVVVRVPLLNWQDVPLRDMVAVKLARYGTITLENDANAFARAEMIRDPARVGSAAVVFWMDAGIGGGIVSEGHLLLGNTGRAGEVGHIFVSPRPGENSRRLEDVAGRIALLGRNRELGGKASTISEFLDERRRRRPAAAQVTEEWVGAMAEGLSSLTSVLNPEALIFSGPMTVVLRQVEAELSEMLAKRLLHGTSKPRIEWRDHDHKTIARSCTYALRADFLRVGR